MSTTLASTWNLSLRGLLMGTGTRYRIADAPTGLGTPSVRSADTPYLDADGVYAAGDVHDARQLSLGLLVLGDSPGHAEELSRALGGAWQASRVDLELLIRVADDRTYSLAGRPRKCELDLKDLKYGHVRAAVLFVGTDPRLYDAVPTEVFLPLGSGVASGLTFPLTFPLIFQEGAVPPGLATITNQGTASTFPRVTITGDVTNPRVENTTTGASLALDLDMTAGDVVVVDMAAHAITHNGTNALGALAAGSTFWPLIPGANHVSFRAAVDTTSAVAALSYRSAWL